MGGADVTHKLQDLDLQKLQAAQMVELRIKGLSMKEIAQQFSVSVDTVNNRINLAKREGMLEDATNKILNLLSTAADVYSRSMLQEEDKRIALEAARDIAFGTGVLSKSNKATVNPQGGEMTLRAWRDKRNATKPTGDESDDSENRLPLPTRKHPTKPRTKNLEDVGEIELPTIEGVAVSSEDSEGL